MNFEHHITKTVELTNINTFCLPHIWLFLGVVMYGAMKIVNFCCSACLRVVQILVTVQMNSYHDVAGWVKVLGPKSDTELLGVPQPSPWTLN